MSEIRTWEQAVKVIAMLKFDLGQSANTIKQMFDDGNHLKYNASKNYYVWYPN